MKFFKTQSKGVLPFDVILYTESQSDSLISYVANIATDTDISKDEYSFSKLNGLPKHVLASDRIISIKLGG